MCSAISRLPVCLFFFPADLPAGPAEYPNEPPSTYKGAKVMLPGEAPAANVILAFEYGGGWRDIQVRCISGCSSIWALTSIGCGCVAVLHAPGSCSTARCVCGRLSESAAAFAAALSCVLLFLQGSVIMTVLTYLLGGGNSFSSGGPGKGMHRYRVASHFCCCLQQ